MLVKTALTELVSMMDGDDGREEARLSATLEARLSARPIYIRNK